ncbi:ISL3 family transposase [Gordonia alkaliphila]|uniref:ISL3 family transposase n=1 Tax=Gordonia alkaliphila TaxID=1053547 RepID=UPI001FF52F46|nr:ISL3 family transposase [Gordonia alkaliphila]MCK0438636.1 ISL3 family transposase [Gordonia alkaliphila]
MRDVSLWRNLLGIEKTVLERVVFDEDAQVLVAHVRPVARQRGRCGRCQRRSPQYDGGPGRRRWRALDLGTIRAELEADTPRVRCREHGVVVAAVPWARHDAGHTYAFDDQVAWLATQASKSTVTELMRIAWRTVGSIIDRVWEDIDAQHDRFDGLRRIGIDEISYKKGHKYLMVVVDHDRRRLVWAAPGRTSATVHEFFDLLGEQRCALITHVSADGADFIDTVVTDRCPAAVRVADPFHIVAWATDALDEVRRQGWNDARKQARAEPKRGRGRPRSDAPPRPASDRAKALKGARYSLWKNPENLTANQQAKLAWIARTDPRLHRAYLLKEGLRVVFALPHDAAAEALDRWISWARRCRIPAFVKLQKRIAKHRDRILAAIEHRLSNGLIESTNTKIRLITRMAYGFKSAEALIAMAMLSLGGHRPVLPGRK